MGGQLPYTILVWGLPLDWLGVVFAFMTLYVPNKNKNQLVLRVAVFKVTSASLPNNRVRVSHPWWHLYAGQTWVCSIPRNFSDTEKYIAMCLRWSLSCWVMLSLVEFDD